MATTPGEVVITYDNLDLLDTDLTYLIKVNPVNNNIAGNSDYIMSFPSSNTSDSGGRPLITATSSEAFWYFANVAQYYTNYSNHDNIQNLREILNGYAFLVATKNNYIGETQGSGEGRMYFLSSLGAMGWQPVIKIPNNNFNYFRNEAS